MRSGITIFAILLAIATTLTIIWAWTTFNESIKQEAKLFKLGCEPKSWNSWGSVTVWSCPARLNIDVNKPETFMDK
ncbi:MAG TPA: hypothetical protein VE089_00770 [Nitrososphaeraceae archaeon]|jgi:hypothetical protein|nr:hypothetical protein [Nitrososphaeraceae archaeon]